jgi:hypothetical protein
MPVKIRKRNGKYRIVEPNNRIAKTGTGKPRDGGGHKSRAKAERQMRAINASLRRKKTN